MKALKFLKIVRSSAPGFSYKALKGLEKTLCFIYTNCTILKQGLLETFQCLDIAQVLFREDDTRKK